MQGAKKEKKKKKGDRGWTQNPLRASRTGRGFGKAEGRPDMLILLQVLISPVAADVRSSQLARP